MYPGDPARAAKEKRNEHGTCIDLSGAAHTLYWHLALGHVCLRWLLVRVSPVPQRHLLDKPGRRAGRRCVLLPEVVANRIVVMSRVGEGLGSVAA